MKAIAPMGMIIFLSIYALSSVCAEDEIYCAIPLAPTEVYMEAYIELVTKKYASQTKGLISYFDGSELVEKIPNSDLAVVILPYGTSSNENDYVLSLVLAVVDIKQKSIVQSYFHKEIAQSDAVYVSDIILDTKTFHDISKHTTFTVTIQYLGSSKPNPYASNYLYMYGLKDGKLSLILDTFEVLDSGGENNVAGTGYEISKMLTYNTHKTSKEYDTLIFDSLSKRVDFDYSDNKSEEKTSNIVRKKVQLDYINGKYINIDLKHLESEAKEGYAQTCLNKKNNDVEIRAFIKKIIVDIEKSRLNALASKFRYPLNALAFNFKNKEEFVTQWQKDTRLKGFMELKLYAENDKYNSTVTSKDSRSLRVFYKECQTVQFAITPGMIFDVEKTSNRYKIVSWTSVY